MASCKLSGVGMYCCSEARKSQHKPISNDEERELMMYNYKPFYSNKDGYALNWLV